MADKPESQTQVFEINGQRLELTIFSNESRKLIRYSVESLEEIDPVDVAYLLIRVSKNICDQAEVDLKQLVHGILTPKDSDPSLH